MIASADYSTIEAISKRLIEATDALGSMVERVGSARQVREFDEPRRKKCLSDAVTDALKANDKLSISAAEHLARSSASYATAMKRVGEDLKAAETTIAEWEVAKAKFEAARSLLSIQKSIVTNL